MFIVQSVDFDLSSYFHVVISSLNFFDMIAGLHPTEAAKLRNYLHFREPVNLKMKSILEMADLNPAVDFLDPLSEDIPKGN